jgi:hypothetical protein
MLTSPTEISKKDWRPMCLPWHALVMLGAHTLFRVWQGKWMALEDYAICLVVGLLCSLQARYACSVGDICSVLQCHPKMPFAFACWNAWSIGLNLGNNHPYLRVGCHSWYQSIMGIIHRVRSYFQKTTVRICLDAHIRIVVVLIGGKLTGIYSLQFTIL